MQKNFINCQFLKKNYINAYVNYGNLKRDLNKFEEAISLYKKALNYEDRLPTIYYLLSMAYQSLGNFKEADNFAYKTIELDKKIYKSGFVNQSIKNILEMITISNK